MSRSKVSPGFSVNENVGGLMPQPAGTFSLTVPPIAVYEVASFYAMYNLSPVGRNKLTVCTNLPCALSGGTRAAEHLKHKLGVDFNETTADGAFTLKEGECMGACGDAPVLLVNNKRMCSWMSDDKLDSLIEELR